MDDIGLIVLQREIAADCAIAFEAYRLAGERIAGCTTRDLEAAAFQFVRCYNALEQAALRLAKAFENQIDDDRGWHAEIMRRLSLELPGIRPRVFEQSDLVHFRELRAFRHLIVHAYDLTLDLDRMRRLLADAEAVFGNLEARYQTFFEAVSRELDR